MCKILCLSDLHGYLPTIPECDLLILAGDYNPSHQLSHQAAYMNGPFRKWLDGLPAKEVVAVGGNHDFVLEGASKGLLEPLRWHYLEDSGIELFGLKIWGSPYTPRFYNWAFMKEDEDLRWNWSQIPEDTDILITHGPPKGVLDRNMHGKPCGSETLWKRVMRVQPKLHVFGHIHEGRGEKPIPWGQEAGPIPPTVFVNATHVDVQYRQVYGPVDVSTLFADEC